MGGQNAHRGPIGVSINIMNVFVLWLSDPSSRNVLYEGTRAHAEQFLGNFLLPHYSELDWK